MGEPHPFFERSSVIHLPSFRKKFGRVLCFWKAVCEVLRVHNSKNLNGNTSREFEKVDSSSADEDVVKNLGKVINNGVDKFWAKRGKVDPAKKLRGFVIGKKAS